MSKIRLYSVQERKLLMGILNGSYKPSFSKSYGVEDLVCMISYKYMLDKLSKKTNKAYVFGKDTCIWSWYQNPYLVNHRNIRNFGRDLVVIIYDIDIDSVVLSDFDIWCDMFIDAKNVDSVVDISDISESQCIQAVSWSIPKEGIVSVESFDEFFKKYDVLKAS